METKPSFMDLTDAKASLGKIKPQIGSYSWQMALLRFRANTNQGYFPNKLYASMQRFFRQDQPYFLGKTSGQIQFLGDWHDKYSVYQRIIADREDDLFSFLQEKARNRPGAFLDIGANMGLVSASIAKGTQHTVIAFEPMSATAQRAAYTFVLNELTNVQLLQIAVGNENGELTFFIPDGQSDMASAFQNEAMSERQMATTETRVMCHTLDWLGQQGCFEKIGFMKIDVEGNEYNVILGARETLKRDQPDLLFEYNFQIAPQAHWSLEDICARIREAGPYSFYVLDGHTLAPFPPADANAGYINVYCTCSAQ